MIVDKKIFVNAYSVLKVEGNKNESLARSSLSLGLNFQMYMQVHT